MTKITCPHCKFTVTLPEVVWPFHCGCGFAFEEDGSPLSNRKVTTSAKSYATAVAKYIAAGRPNRTDEEVRSLLAICKRCEYFNKKRGECTQCGCCVNQRRHAWWNKLRMATESCPIGKW